MMNTLSCDILGKIFTYLPLTEVVAFQLLNRQCGEAITSHGKYFYRPSIVMDLKVNVGDELTFEITLDGQARVARFVLFPDGRVENKSRNAKMMVPESREDHSSSLQAILKWIRWNSTILQSKWGKKSEQTSVIQLLIIDCLDVHFWSIQSQQRLVDMLKCEQCFIETLKFIEGGRLKSGKIDKASQFAVLLHRSTVVQKLALHLYVRPECLIPLAIEWNDGVSLNIGTLRASEVAYLLAQLKETWISRRKEWNQKPWTLRIDFRFFNVFLLRALEISDLEALFAPIVDTDFSITVKKDVYPKGNTVFTAEIKAL